MTPEEEAWLKRHNEHMEALHKRIAAQSEQSYKQLMEWQQQFMVDLMGRVMPPPVPPAPPAPGKEAAAQDGEATTKPPEGTFP